MIEDKLRKDLLSEKHIENVFQKHVIDGSSYFFNKTLNKPDLEYDFRHELASTLNINIHDIIIVGSAKLGFSLKDYTFNKFDHAFNSSKNPNKKSDIDIAVVSSHLFEEISRKVYEVSNHFDSAWAEENWKTNNFNEDPQNLLRRYSLYVAKGWLRPDLMPLIYYSSAPWVAFVEKWRGSLERKISIGIYSNWYYLKHYQMDNLTRLRAKLLELQVI